MMKTHIEHQDRGERKAHGLRFGRLWALAGFVVLFCLIQGLIGIAQVATSVEITFSPSSPVVGQDVTVTWTLTVQTTSAVTFDPGSPNLSRLITAPGGGNILNDSVSTTGELSPFSSGYSFTANQAGTYTIEGDYAGCPTCDPVLNASSKSTTLAVNKAATSTGVEADVNPSATGQTVTFTATVSDDPAAIGVPTGTVTFYADGTPIAVDRPLSGDPATATCTASFNAEDSTIEITATYNGDTNYNSSSGTLAPDLTVNKAATTTYVDSDKATAVTGETVTLGAEVTGSGTTTPTGTLEFFANSSSLGSVSVNASGVAILATSFNVTDSPVSISATYSGDANYEDSSGTMTGTITVDQATTLVLITSDLLTNTVVGEPYTVGGTVKPTYANGTHTTDGTVQVSDDGTPVCTCEDTTLTWNIDHWDWSCSLTSTTAGNRTITATFDPTETTTPPDPGADVNYKTNKATDSHEVDQAATTTTVSSSVNPSVTGQGVTFTATVVSVAPGSGTPPDGTTVTFVVKDKNGSDSPYLAALSGGGGQASTTPITDLEASLSPYTVTATFDPSDTDPDYGTSTSAAFTQNVNKATTITTITGTDLGIDTDVGESYTVTGTVEVDGPGGAIPPSGGGDPTTTGNVEVSDGTDTVTVLGTALTWGANKWNWSLITFTSTTAGAKILTATYKGDDNYQASSDTDSHTVNKAGTTVAITGTNLDTADTVVGQSYEVKGTVTPVNADGTHDTTGAVQVSDGTDTVTIPGTDLSWGTNDWTWTTDSLSPPGFISTTAGAKTITATYLGDANYEDDTTLVGDGAGKEPVDHQVDPTGTTVVIDDHTPDSSIVGQSYTVSGTVTPNEIGTHLNSGSVEVSDDGTPVCTCTDTTLTWDTDHWDWSCDLISTTAGTGDPKTKTLTATYSGDSNYDAPATPPTTTHVVNQASTTVEITGAALDTATVVGETYTVSGRVTPANTTGTHDNTGTVEVSDGAGGATCTDTTLTWSVDHWEWSCDLVSTTAGNKTITATFDPTETTTPPGTDPNYATSLDNTASHTVNQADTTTTVTIKAGSNNPSVTGEAVTFTATVAVVSPGSGTPVDGTTVDFEILDKDSNSVDTGSPTLLSGTAEYPVLAGTLVASKSPYTVTATFDPSDTDPNYNTSTSSKYTQNVYKANTTTAIDSIAPATTDVGETYTTVSGTVAVVSPGSGTPSAAPTTGGTVEVSDGTDIVTGIALGWNSTSSYWDWSTNSFCSTTAGSKTITATYVGDTKYQPSSGTDSHTVDKADTTTTVTSSVNPCETGQSVTFTATVDVETPGSGTPVGTATFVLRDKDDITIVNSGPVSLSSGVATFTTTLLLSEHSPVSVKVQYSGDADFAPSSGTLTGGQIVRPSAFAITSDDPDPSVVNATITVTWAYDIGSVFPEDGNLVVSMTDGTDTVSCTSSVEGGDSAGSCLLDTTGIDSGVRILTATYTGTPTASDTENHTVTPRDTAVSVSGPSGSACVCQPVLLTATVTDQTAPPDGPGFTETVTWSSDGNGTFDPVVCNISQGGQCSTYYTPSASDVGNVNITASYSGDDAYGSSTSPDFVLYVGKRSTKTTVFGSDTPLVVEDTATFLVTVSDTSNCVPIVPTGEVSITVSPSGAGVLTGGSHTLTAADGGQFTFMYKPTSKATTPHTFTATYTGSTTHNGSAGSFDQAIIGRAADIQMSVAPTSAYVYQPVTIAIHVEDDTTAGTGPIPSGTVDFAVDDGSGTFVPASATCALDANGNGTVVYAPGALVVDGGNDYTNPLKTITATYSDPSNVHAGTSTVGHLNVILRPTTTTVKFDTTKGILVNETTHFNVTVEDAAGVPLLPGANDLDGTIGIKKSLEPKSEGHITPFGGSWPMKGPAQSKWRYEYYRTALDAEGGDNDTITATYTPNDGIHTGSNGAYGKSISRRPTVTTITNAVATITGITYDVEVAEDPSNTGHGGAVAITGDFIEKGGTSLTETDVGDAPTATGIVKMLPVNERGTTLLVNVTVHYKPNERVHMTSLDSANVNRSEFITVTPPTDPSNDGSDCNDGCGDGGTDVEQMIFNMNAAVVALQATNLGLDAAAIIASLFPNPVVTVGIIFESGAEIPAKDIVIAVFNGAKLLLDIAIMAMETDLDGDGLPDTVENTVTHTKYNDIDSDDDGMSDLDEIDSAGGYYGGTRRPDPNNPDSDGDGLLDGDEVDIYQTFPCVADTDCDVLDDGEEVGTWSLTDLRDHLDPLMQDTDGDGLSDYVEYGAGKVVTSTGDTSYSSYGNSDDSDGDGIQDGMESTNLDAVWDYTQIGGTGTTGYGETHLCMADTDGDGLNDGEEEALFGRSLDANGINRIDVHSTLGTITTPALDDDSDDDGLSDYEEQVVTGTDPLNWDSDDDGISDADELIATEGDWPARSFIQSSDPLDPDTDDDGLTDYIEYGNNGVGTGLGTLYSRHSGPAGDPDTDCPLVNDDDSDNDGLQDGTESWDGDDTITTGTIGNSLLQADTSPSGETDFCNPDTDGDGLTDGEEVALLGGLPVSSTTGFTSVIPKGVSTTFGLDGDPLTATVPALDDDSDNDGLSDYEEVNITHTDPLDQDSDNDTLSDANELIATGGSWPNRTFIQESDPLDPDTDDDDLYDQIEYPGSGLGTSRGTGGTPDNICPYVNDDDSDDDGLQDGYEDKNHDGIWNNYVLGNSGSAGSGETNPCDPDTDRDGLSDGEEEGLIARSATWQLRSTAFGEDGAASTVNTVPALDDDSDNDGLSDYEEVNATMTDPLDADSDDDTLSDANELIATGWLSLNLGYTLNFPPRVFQQESDPLDPDTDDDDLHDYIEYPGSGLGTSRGIGGTPDNICPYVNDADSDDDGLQDGTEDANHDGTWGVLGAGIVVGTFSTQAEKPTVLYWETHLCNPDTDGDGLLDGEEVALIGGRPILGRPRPVPGFHTVIPEGVSASVGSPGSDLDPTVPALDDDCDNDGLSDYEEVNITHTDPLDADSDNDTISDANELIATGGSWPKRTFDQESDPLDIDTDDDGLTDNIEYAGTNLGTTYLGGVDGDRDLTCPYVNDDDSDDDGLQDGVEDANHDGVWSGITIGSFGSQASKSGASWETNLCNPDTDGDGLLDGEEVSLIGGGPVLGRPADWPAHQPSPGFNTVTPEAVSTELPYGTTDLADVPEDYTHDPSPSPGTQGSLIAPYEFNPADGGDVLATIPALDVDSDNDGLSDYEEVNITMTDPLDQDTDNDTLMDSDELIATGGTGDVPGNPGTGPRRTFDQESDPLDINTDDDDLFDPQEYYDANAVRYGSGLSAAEGAAPAGARDTHCPYVNDDDSDDDGIQDGEVVTIAPPGVITKDGDPYSYTHYEDFIDLNNADENEPVVRRTVATPGYGEQSSDIDRDVCDADSDNDGLLDGEEVSIGTNPNDWDTDDDGRNDWHEVTGGGPIPTDPFDPDTDDDGLLDSVEVHYLSNTTNPVNADTDGDGLCDGGTGTPWMKSGDARVVVNPICKSCAEPGLDDCGATGGIRTGSVDGIGDHPNPHGYGEDKNGNGDWDGSIGDKWQSGEEGTPETDPNQYDTDGDGDGDGVEVLGFSTSRQHMIPPADIFGRPITVVYPACGCLEPLILDTDGDGLTDGYEDRNHDGNFDFLPSEFDHQDPLPGPPIPYPTETNPCDPDTDHDELTDWEERYQRQPLLAYPDLPIDNDGDGLIDEDPVDGIDNDLDGLVDEDPAEGPIELTFNPTNPLDHDTDNDRIYDGPEVYWVCVAVTYSQLDNDGDALIDEDPIDGLDNDGDGLFDEDPVDFFVRFVPMLDPTNRDSDSDGWIDGLDDDPCNSELIPILQPVQIEPIDSDGDGFADDDELVAGTHPNDPEDHPTAYCMVDLDFDQEIDDRMWLEPSVCCGIANSVAIDIDSNVLIDARLQIVQPRDVKKGDFDGDGAEDDYRYVVEYAFSNYRVLQPRIVATIDDYNGDLTIDHAEVVRK